MTFAETVLATAAILAVPGPTNAVLAVAGAERGRAAFRLVPLALACWLLVVGPLAAAGTFLLDGAPLLRTVLSLLAAAWAGWLAVDLWRAEAGGLRPTATRGRLAVTTLLNPKALVLGLAILPAEGGRLLAHLVAFAILAGLVAAGWVALGLLMRGGGTGLPPVWRRVAAVWMAGLAAILAIRALA